MTEPTTTTKKTPIQVVDEADQQFRSAHHDVPVDLRGPNVPGTRANVLVHGADAITILERILLHRNEEEIKTGASASFDLRTALEAVLLLLGRAMTSAAHRDPKALARAVTEMLETRQMSERDGRALLSLLGNPTRPHPVDNDIDCYGIGVGVPP